MRGYKRLILLLILLPLLVWAEKIWTDFSPKPEVIEVQTDDSPVETASVSEVLTEVNTTIAETETET